MERVLVWFFFTIIFFLHFCFVYGLLVLCALIHLKKNHTWSNFIVLTFSPLIIPTTAVYLHLVVSLMKIQLSFTKIKAPPKRACSTKKRLHCEKTGTISHIHNPLFFLILEATISMLLQVHLTFSF